MKYRLILEEQEHGYDLGEKSFKSELELKNWLLDNGFSRSKVQWTSDFEAAYINNSQTIGAKFVMS